MKILLIPDSFKGTLSALEVCRTIEQALAEHSVTSIPAADGGEGTLDAFYHAWKNSSYANAASRVGLEAGMNSGVQIISAPSKDASGKDIEAPYLLKGRTAIFEMAKVAGFRHESARDRYPGKCSADFRPVMDGTSYGVGMLMKDAVNRGARQLIVGLGGSCTNDGGCGMAAALGTRFHNNSGESFIPSGARLSDIALVDNSASISLLAAGASISRSRIDIVGMCDVINPLLGSQGAASVFAPQKGASPEEVQILDRGLGNLVSSISDGIVIRTVHGLESAPALGGSWAHKLAEMKGSGAAGGAGYGIRALLGGRLESGIDLFLDTIRFDELLFDADCVITGEGSFDSQSLGGKAVCGICRRAKAAGVPVILVAGSVNAEEKDLRELGVAKCFETDPLDFDRPVEEIKKAAFANLTKAACRLADYLKLQ